MLLPTVQHALGGPAHMTVGLVAVFITVLCIIAADTGAYFFGKSMVRVLYVASPVLCIGVCLAPR